MSEPIKKDAHIFEREKHDHYVEPAWCVELVADAEDWPNTIWDPCCGFGTIPEVFKARGHKVIATDLIDRGYGISGQHFLAMSRKYVQPVQCIVFNPPYKNAETFIDKALHMSTEKVAAVLPLKWLSSRRRKAKFQGDWPLRTVYVLSNRPSMLPGYKILAGEKAGGGTIDYAWFVFEHGFTGNPEIQWLATPGRASATTGGSRPAATQALKRGGA
ncbi:MAG: hypothetical protein ACX94B_13080 [Henriciella sp.]